jgi:phospholipase C
MRRPRIILAGVTALGLAAFGALPAVAGAGPAARAANPLQHIVVIFQENVSFDHYFATYPKAANPAGQPPFTAADDTPHTAGLGGPLLTSNPNGVNPQRLDRSPNDLLTCDMDHSYTDEQKAYDNFNMDKFIQFGGNASGTSPTGVPCDPKVVMNYYDGNSVTALWNYAQHFAMSDHSFGTSFGPSSVGALNLVAGQTAGVIASSGNLKGEVENNTVIGDPQPLGDSCSTRDAVRLSGANVGDLLNAQGVTWGWFEGGFRAQNPDGTLNCSASHNIGAALGGTGKTGSSPWGTKVDYIPHHEPFQYYASTANPAHLPPTSVASVGMTDQANHQYDLTDFWSAVASGNMPAVSFLKAPGYQDGHAQYSDPIDEQQFLVSTINALERTPEWAHTAVVISYDDSDGWYDHLAGPLLAPSSAPADALTGAGVCGAPDSAATQDRCGVGPRLPLLVISPFAKGNFVSHGVSTQSSILRFIEDTFNLGRIGGTSFDSLAPDTIHSMLRDHAQTAPLFLDPSTGAPT